MQSARMKSQTKTVCIYPNLFKPLSYWIRTTLLLLICSAVSLFAVAQETSKDLGVEVFRVFQSEELDGLDRFIPTMEEAISIVNGFGKEHSPAELEILKEKYPEEVERFRSTCSSFLDRGVEWGITWKKTRLKKVEVSNKILRISETDATEQIDIDSVDILFSCKKKEYRIILKGVFELDGKWFLGGNQIAFIQVE